MTDKILKRNESIVLKSLVTFLRRSPTKKDFSLTEIITNKAKAVVKYNNQIINQVNF